MAPPSRPPEETAPHPLPPSHMTQIPPSRSQAYLLPNCLSRFPEFPQSLTHGESPSTSHHPSLHTPCDTDLPPGTHAPSRQPLLCNSQPLAHLPSPSALLAPLSRKPTIGRGSKAFSDPAAGPAVHGRATRNRGLDGRAALPSKPLSQPASVPLQLYSGLEAVSPGSPWSTCSPLLLALGWLALSPGHVLCHLGLLPFTLECVILRPRLSQPKYLSLCSWLGLLCGSRRGQLPWAGELKDRPGGAARNQGPSNPTLAAPGPAQEHLGRSAQSPPAGTAVNAVNPKPGQAHSRQCPGTEAAPTRRCLQTLRARPRQRLLVTGH